MRASQSSSNSEVVPLDLPGGGRSGQLFEYRAPLDFDILLDNLAGIYKIDQNEPFSLSEKSFHCLHLNLMHALLSQQSNLASFE